jgi:hypothetical protein
MVLRKNSGTDLPEFMGSLVIPTFTYRPVIEPGMEIPVANQSGEYHIVMVIIVLSGLTLTDLFPGLYSKAP